MKRIYSFFCAAMLFLFAAQQVRAYDFPYYFYIPASLGFATESGCAMQWYVEGEDAQITLLTADPEASNWYTATVSRDNYDYEINFNLLNAPTQEAATQSLANPYGTYGGYFLVGKDANGSFQLYGVDSYYSQYPNDYRPYNLQAHQGQDTLYVSWESNSDPYSWQVYVYDADNLNSAIANTFVYDYQKSGYVRLNNAESMQIVWKVYPNVSYDVQQALTVYSEPMTVLPSPKVATNIHATLNADGSYTFAWDAALSPDVKQYWVRITDPSGSSVYSTSNYVRGTSFTASFDVLFSGTYTIEVHSFGEDTWYDLGQATGTFDIAPVAAHDITVRFLLGSTSGMDTSGGVELDIQKTADNQEVVSATQEPYGWWSYSFNTTERGARVGVRTGYWSNMIDIYGDTCLEYNRNSGSYLDVACDARATDYEPHDILASLNEDGTYTISWLMDATERVDHYNVYMTNAMTGQNILDLSDVKATQVTTGALEAGSYHLQISVYEQVPTEWGGYNYYQIGVASTNITIEEQPAHDITVRVLPQPGAEEWYAFTYNADDYDYTTQVVFTQEEGSPWFTYTFNTTSPAVNVKFMKASDISSYNGGTLIACQENTCIEYEDEFKIADCNSTLKDFTVSNPQREELGNSQIKFTWECASDPGSFAIYITDADDYPIKVLYPGGADRSYTEIILVDSAMATVNWFVVPVTRNGAYLWDLRVDGAPFSLEASPYVPTNIVATQNPDFTWTITWDACPEPVYAYSVYDGIAGYTTWVNGTSYTSQAANKIGMYTFRITPQMRNGDVGATRAITVEVQPVPARDITVRLLMHPYNSSSYIQDLYLSDTYDYITAVDEGNGWYSYTFSSTKPGQQIQLYGSQFTVSKDTCFEYTTYLGYAPCDAVQHDYRVAEGSLQAVSVPGKVSFSWAPSVEKAESYYFVVEYYNNDYGYWYSIVSETVKDTCYTYMVPDDKDGLEVRWYVYPQSPHYLYNNRVMGETITLQKSTVELSNLQATTTDSITYHFSWASNANGIQYEFAIPSSYYGDFIYSIIQTSKTQDYTFISGAYPYQWCVRAVDANGEPLTNWVYGENVQVKSSLRAITNLQGAVAGNKLNYTWSKTCPLVSVYMECQSEEFGWMTVINDSILSGNSLSVTAEMDGRYMMRITPVIESAPGKYSYLNEDQACYLNYFSGQTYHIAVSTTTGGFLVEELTGDYPAGYTLYLRIWEDQGYRFVGWSDGNTERRRVYTVEGDANLIALFEPIPLYNVTLEATTGGKLIVDYSGVEIARLDTALYADNFLYFEAVVEDGYVFYGWSDGFDATRMNRNIAISQDTAITAIFKPICYVTTSAGVGGRIQVTGGQYDKARKAYKCVYGSELTLKANPDEGYRFAQWNDGNTNVTRTITVTADMTISATFTSVETQLNKYTVRILTSDPELGMVSQVSGTYTEGDKVTITATPAINANFVQWSDGNTNATRVITVNADITLTASFAIKRLTLSISAGQGGSVNTEVNGIYDYGTQVTITATADAGYHFTGWSDGYPYASRMVEMTEDITLTASFAQEQYLITFLNADGSFIEANYYLLGQMPACSVTPTLAPTAEWIYTFTGWNPALAPVTGSTVYTAVYSQAPNPGSGFENIIAPEKATKVLINGQIFILRGDRIYTIQGQLVK